ncbi:MAG TPA: NADH-quinone oxidoreductase subunit M [Desulfomonilaceae bacterium]|nr:NADH-quinone oxidoreductase subunit M [Desulfomonilaceae bacterium]
MILLLLIFIPLAAGILAWPAGRWGARWPRWISLVALGAEFVIAFGLWAQHWHAGLPAEQSWLVDFRREWIPQLGISFHVSLDGLSLLLVVLTVFLGIAGVVVSWTEIRERVGFFHFNLMSVLSGIIGVFVATDLILFYVFWELMLVPMYFLIAIWGHENRIYASMKFFIFTQASGLLMLLSILGLFFIHASVTGVYTFDYFQLLDTPMTPAVAKWLMLGFFVAFAVKLPIVGLHTWLPDAHTEAPTAGSVILAGLLLKTGGYGLIRFVWPLFPGAAGELATTAMVLAVAGILYGAVMAFSQTDFKRLVAYTSVSHLGFVLLGIFAGTEMALQGAVMQMISHGISTAALFMLVGMLQERTHTRDLDQMGGLWTTVPTMAAITQIFALASLGLPGTANFVGEFLVLAGSYAGHPRIAAVAASGLIFSAVYSLWMMYRVFFGAASVDWRISDLSLRESWIMVCMIAAVFWMGVHPQPVLNTSGPAVAAVTRTASASLGSGRRHDLAFQQFSGTSDVAAVRGLLEGK